jgi:hypothetical protein
MRIFGRNIRLPWEPSSAPATSPTQQRQPAATPVSQAFTVEPGAMAQAIQHTLAVIDSVHGDGAIPPLVGRTRVMPDLAGKFEPGQGIVVNPQTSYPALVAAHEIGHVLDFYEFTSQRYESLQGVEMIPFLNAWLSSQACRQLQNLRAQLSLPIADPLQDQLRKDDLSRVNYLLGSNEAWCRAYSQWLAISSQEPALIQQLNNLRQARNNARFAIQWDDSDFGPLHQQIDLLFRRKGWIR